MTQDEIWMQKYEGVKAFILRNGRNPSKYDAEERGAYVNWLRHNRKLYNAGALNPERVRFFEELLALCERYRHKKPVHVVSGFKTKTKRSWLKGCGLLSSKEDPP